MHSTPASADTGKPLLAVQSLGIGFADGGAGVEVHPVVSDLNFSIGRGERVALVGESGSGKTLTAHAIMRLTEGAHYSGRILFEGEDILQAGEPRLRALRGGQIGMIF